MAQDDRASADGTPADGQRPVDWRPVDWRPVVAALANRDARAVWAQLIADGGPVAGMSPARQRRALALLEGVGLVHRAGDDSYEPVDTAFRELLAASASLQPRREGVERFLRPDGRIDRFPAAADDRSALLAHIGDRVLADGETVTERDLTDRLARFGDDPVTLRRYLVDAGILLRTRSGSEYTRAEAPTDS
ncbi:DUF2087 domain-containing protein [Leifsonia sp. 1010]|uniref:DUF2087 domain-containing protein n=1 Tax=Leifsonia sp. 1010 TaxID=2817769 RepID=UPI00285FBA91|nr:DUF2087 domain-containing protein [Leifsonia sp. 1010]MDR6611377.1 hypothetical protein [Leifsonia sp. 1010]